ncbi:hypothetical protein [Thioflexithrix psekupsensis]|uniref:Uncharacterized protein n=1 Tax=Thioflexithrix psekupsensis TaxID=1570016 RepID=A0A251XAV8_9GAMM|nr:hypothetical protein [Thioflexithrix psekupsensis]OUD15561.1 hypothetical protein TPSD3_03305 [Thioflexithrix psekupsensis]
MSNLRDNLSDYIADLTALLADHLDDGSLLTAAKTAYGENDPRYLVLCSLLSQTKKGGFGTYKDKKGSGENQTVHKTPRES